MMKRLWGRGATDSAWVGLVAVAFSLACVQGMAAQEQKPDATQLVRC